MSGTPGRNNAAPGPSAPNPVVFSQQQLASPPSPSGSETVSTRQRSDDSQEDDGNSSSQFDETDESTIITSVSSLKGSPANPQPPPTPPPQNSSPAASVSSGAPSGKRLWAGKFKKGVRSVVTANRMDQLLGRKERQSVTFADGPMGLEFKVRYTSRPIGSPSI